MYSARLLEVFVLVILSSQVRTADLPVPVALYPLNGQHATNDIGPNKNQPGKPNDVQLAPGPYGHPQGSYQFSGSSTSYIEIPNNGGLDTRYSTTVLAWVNHENEKGPIFNYGTDTSDFRFWMNIKNYAINVFANCPSWIAQPYSPIAPNSWFYVGVTYDYSSGSAKVWVNGQPTSEVDAGIFELETHHDVRMGVRDGKANYFKGRICCVQVYNKTLSQQEIVAVQNRTFWETVELKTETIPDAGPDVDDQSFMFGHFHPVFSVKPQQGGILATFTASTAMECMLRCSRMTECKSVSINGINISGGSSGGYCQLYLAPFEHSVEYESHLKAKQYYNKNKLI